jgi:Fe2+ transport system protein FeoA
MPVGATARIAYVNTREDAEQHRLARFGVVPGNHLTLHQRKPCIVVALESSRLAMEACTAGDILVWKTWADAKPADQAKQAAPRRRRLWPL